MDQYRWIKNPKFKQLALRVGNRIAGCRSLQNRSEYVAAENEAAGAGVCRG